MQPFINVILLLYVYAQFAYSSIQPAEEAAASAVQVETDANVRSRQVRAALRTTVTNSPQPELSGLRRLSKLPPHTTSNVEYITNREFIYRVCDFTYGTRTEHNPLSFDASGACKPSEILPAKSIICVRGDLRMMEVFMKEGSCFQRAPFILVTLETDESSPANPGWVKTKNLIQWYGWNAHANSGVIPIPIGLNSDSMLKPMRHARRTPWDKKKHQVLLAYKQHTPERMKLNHIAQGLSFAVKFTYTRTYENYASQVGMYEAMSKFK